MRKFIAKFLKNKKELFLATIISLLATVLSTAKYFSQILQVPKNQVFIGMTHYYEDFYYYLDQFYQGAHGGWLTYNNFTSEKLKPTFIYFNNILLGKIGGLFGLESYVTYNVSLIVLKFIFFILCYLLLMKIFPYSKKLRIAAFLIFIFATSFPLIYFTKNGIVNMGPVVIFRVKNSFFTRFENIPGNYIQRILFILLLLISVKYTELVKNNKIKSVNLIYYVTIFIVLTGWLTLSQPVNGLIFVLIFCLFLLNLYSFDNFKKYFHYFLPITMSISLGFIITAAVMWVFIHSDPIYLEANIWDYNEYSKQFTILNLFRHIQAFGMIGILFVLGAIRVINKKRNIAENILLTGSFISIFGFLLPYMFDIPVPGFWFVTVTTYLFFSAVAVYGILFIETIIRKKMFFIVLILYLLLSILTIYPSYLKESAKVTGATLHFTYIPKEQYDGLMFIRNLSPKDAIVLANPLADTDLYIPGLTGKKSFTGHSLVTLHSKEKDKIVIDFYYNWTDNAKALEFLKKNNIKYILHTIYANNFHSTSLKNKYPFLKEIYRNNFMAVFTY